MILIAPSLLSADFTRLDEAVRLVEDAGADVVHIDIMDGHFVPNLTIGPRVVELLKTKTSLPLDVHLMVDRPDEVIPWFLDAGADWISIHAEASRHLHRDVSLIRSAGRRAGVALNPATPLVALQEILRDLDFVLLMCVNPGRGSQAFIEASHEKIQALRRWRGDLGLDRPWIEIDGGVTLENAPSLVRSGAEIFVAGNAVFNAPDPREAVRRLKAAAGEADTR
jgi:ribulose-phosphate 3-epimerase